MKIRCNFTIELKKSDDFKKVIRYMKDIGVYDDFITHRGLTKTSLRTFLKSEAEDMIKSRIGI